MTIFNGSVEYQVFAIQLSAFNCRALKLYSGMQLGWCQPGPSERAECCMYSGRRDLHFTINSMY